MTKQCRKNNEAVGYEIVGLPLDPARGGEVIPG